MNIYNLDYFCPDCAEWFDGTKIAHELIERDDRFHKFHPCDCGGESGRQDADEIPVQKPWAAAQVQALVIQKYRFEQIIEDLDQQIAELGGDQS